MEPSHFSELMGIEREAMEEFIAERAKCHSHKTGAPFGMVPKDEVLFIFSHLRHFPVDIFLGAIFHKKKQTAQKVRVRLLDWIYELLKVKLTMRSLNYRVSHGVGLFHSYYTFGVDGSEQGVCAASHNPFKNTRFYSTKKGYHTMNILVLIALNGKVLWVSKAYPGSWTDIQILRETCAEWMAFLREWERGLGDLGFEGVEELGVDAPPSRASPLYKIFASYRIAVENAIADIKDWRCTKDDVRDLVKDEEVLLENQRKRWVVVSVLKNEYNRRGDE